MITVTGKSMAISCHESGAGLVLIDQIRGTRWRLDEKTSVFGSDLLPLIPCGAKADGPRRLVLSYKAGSIPIFMSYEIKEDYIEIRVPVPGEDSIGRVAMPGSFYSENEELKLLLPIMQGMLWDGRGEDFSELLREGGHGGFTMAFIGYLGKTGGLLFTAETRDDVEWWIGKDGSKHIWAANIQMPSLGKLRYERVGRLYFTDPDIVSLAMAYRRKVIGQGRFKSWEEKIAQRPGLERLFGALMCFIGYCQDDIDYVEECRKLKGFGFDKALIYPARFNVYDPNIRMGGQPPIHLSREEVAAIKDLGYDIAPWSWINEALDDGSEKIRRMYRRGADGELIPNWAIDSQQWYLVCTTFMEEYQRNAVRSSLSDMTWDHFDVLSCASLGECYALDHPGHLGRPLPRTEDREWIKRTFLAGQAGQRAVSSEGFNDAYSLELDLASVKAWPQYGGYAFRPVPLTMLVYHDSIIHSWWEVHNYNNHWFGGRIVGKNLYEYGGGRPRLMAALDALMGCPPDVFPFGAQYQYTGRGRETFLFRFRFEDPVVQAALKEALPVARLHGRIGKLPMIDFRFLSEDGGVQQTIFADGTRVVANFTACEFKDGEIGSVGPESWKVLD